MEVGLAGTAPRQRAATSPDIGNLGVGQFYIATEGSSYPPWLAGLARQRWEVELPAAAAMQGGCSSARNQRTGTGGPAEHRGLAVPGALRPAIRGTTGARSRRGWGAGGTARCWFRAGLG